MQKLFISSLCILLLVFFKLVGASQYVCPESKCGDDQGPTIQSPLRISVTHQCGNPGLECNGGYEQQILIKSFVKHIDYKRQEIQVYDPSNCLLLKLAEITTMPPSPFYLTNFRNLNLTLFSCPTSVARDMDLYQVPCLGDPGSRIYAIDSTYELEDFFQNLQSCSKMYDVLSVPFGDWAGNGRVLQFKWSKPNCTECEAEGKRCKWKNNGTNSEIECQHVSKPSKENIIFIANFKHRYIYVSVSNTWKLVVTGGVLETSWIPGNQHNIRWGVEPIPFGKRDEIKTLHLKWSKPNCIECEAEGKRRRLKNNGTKSEIEFVDRRKPSKDNASKSYIASMLLMMFLMMMIGILCYML
ncbi:hypothetical protein DVH24_025646 [Malus domestica]|uniref:RING-type E3 ubiquitin transferase n=1 Tax=Malus domestica TaxID=3750 RepID=A0A498KDS0_MALDO|nr:hypothetical protein DVH24_025646 [Malus domestica]